MEEKMPVRHNYATPCRQCVVAHVVRDLAQRETLEDREGDGEGRRQVASGNRSGDDDGEDDTEGVAKPDVEQTAEAGLLHGRSDEESRGCSESGVCVRFVEGEFRSGCSE